MAGLIPASSRFDRNASTLRTVMSLSLHFGPRCFSQCRRMNWTFWATTVAASAQNVQPYSPHLSFKQVSELSEADGRLTFNRHGHSDLLNRYQAPS